MPVLIEAMQKNNNSPAKEWFFALGHRQETPHLVELAHLLQQNQFKNKNTYFCKVAYSKKIFFFI